MSDQPSLFDLPPVQPLAAGAVLLNGFVEEDEADVLAACVSQVVAAAPWRHLVTPGGQAMSVAMTNCGALGWVSDRRGYRYEPHDPQSGLPWPALPKAFHQLAQRAALAGGFEGFEPDACLVNRYQPGTRLSLHQDRDERDHGHPIVSVSLGLPAVFLFGGLTRTAKAQRVPLQHRDVVVWGGPARLAFHGVMPLAEGSHPQWGALRVNLTFRRAG